MKYKPGYLICLFFSIFFLSQSIAQVTIWSEDFNSYPDATTSGANWNASLYNNCDGDDNAMNGTGFQWGVFGGQFVIQDVEGFDCCEIDGTPNPAAGFGNSANVLAIGLINISGFQNVSISMDVMGTGGLDCFNACNNPFPFCQGGNDQLILSYTVDVSAPVVFGYMCGGNWCIGDDFVCDIPSGTLLTIEIVGGNQANGENYLIDNIFVQGYLTDPVIASAVNTTVCEGDNIELLETGGAAVGWSWDGPDGFISTDQNPIVPSVTMSNAGIYNVTITDIAGCTYSSDVNIAVQSVIVPVITNYDDACLSGSPTLLNVIEDGVSGTWVGPGVSGPPYQFNPNIGVGTYTLTFVPDPGQCATNNTTDITVIDMADASFSYPENSYCTGDMDPLPDFILTGGGVFSINGGAIINSLTGEIDLSSTVSGNVYTVSYTVGGVCPGTEIFVITINENTDAGFDFQDNVCINSSSNPIPGFILQPGIGTFSVSGGAIIDPFTGELELSSLTANTVYVISYTIPGSCGDVKMQNLIAFAGDDPSFSYPETSYCAASDINPFPNFVAQPGGVFSVNGGAIIDPVTGELNLSSTIPGNLYTINYTTAGVCPGSESFFILMEEGETPDFDQIGPFCNTDDAYTLPSVSNNGVMGGWDIGNQLDPGDVMGTSITILFTPDSGQCAGEYSTEVMISSSLSAGENGSLSLCSGDPSLFDFTAFLNGTPDSGGTWTDDDGTGIDPNADPENVDLSTLNAGSYNFSYVQNNEAPCMPSSAILAVNIYNAPDAGTDGSVSLCVGQDVLLIDFESLIGMHDSGGFWLDDDLAGVNLSDPTSVDFQMLGPGTYNFSYSISSTLGCQINNPYLTFSCDNNGTDADLSDDQFYYSLNLSASNAGPSYSISGDDTQSNLNYDQDYGPFGPFNYNDGDLNLIFSDDSNIGCMNSITVNANEVCSQDCNLFTPSVRVFCDDNGTEQDPSDDLFRYTIYLSNVNASSSFSISGDDARPGLSYHTINGPFGPFPISNGNLNLQLSDDLDGACQINYEIEVPSTCSDGCSFSSSLVQVELIDSPDAGIENALTLCEGESTPIDFLAALEGTPDPGGAWTDVDLTGIDPNSDPNAVDISSLSEGVYQFSYTLTGQSPCTDSTSVLSLNITDIPNPGNSTSSSVCNEGGALLDFIALLGNPDPGGTWMDDNSSGVDPNTDPTAVNFDGVSPGNYMFSYTIAASGACPEVSASVELEVLDAVNAGMDNTISFCEGETNLVDFFGALGGSPEPGGTWTDVDGTAIDPNTDPNNVDISSLVAGSFQFDYILMANSPCQDDMASLTINVSDIPSAGISGSETVCNQDSNPIDFFAILGNADPGGIWTDDNNSGIDPNIDATNIDFNGIATGNYGYTYTIAASGACPEVSSSIQIEVLDAVNAGMDSTISFCEGEPNPVDFFGSLAGLPNSGGTWIDVDGTGVDPNADPNNVVISSLTAGSFQFDYMVLAESPCQDDIASLTLNITDIPNAGMSGSDQVCNQDSNPIDFFAILGNADPGGVWTDDNNSGINPNVDATNIDFNGTTTGNYSFTYTIAASGACPEVSSIVMIEVVNASNAGLDSALSFCEGEQNPIDFLNSLEGTPDLSGTWVDVDGTGIDPNIDPSNVNISSLPEGIFQFDYIVSGNSPCQDDIASLTLNITDIPHPGSSGSASICNRGNSIVDFLSVLIDADPGGTWSDNDGSGIDVNSDPMNVDFTGTAPGTYSFTYTIPASGTCPEVIANVDIEIFEAPNAGVPALSLVCEGMGTAVNFLDSLNGTPDPGGIWFDLDGTGIDPNTNPNAVDLSALIPGTYLFAYIVDGGQYCNDSTSNLTVEILINPFGGTNNNTLICEEDITNPLDFGNLLGNPDPGGTWTDLDASGVDPSGDPSNVNISSLSPGVYQWQYQPLAFGPCTGSGSILTLEIVNSVSSGDDTGYSFCRTEAAPIDLISVMNGNPDIGGSWMQLFGNAISIDKGIADFTGAENGFYQFQYFIAGSGNCDPDSSLLDITILEGAYAGEDASSGVCNTDLDALVDLESLIGTHDSGGTWFDIDGTGTDLSDPTIVNFNGVPIGSYAFEYVVPGIAQCPQNDTSFVMINVISSPNPGIGNAIMLCEGMVTSFDLFGALIGNPDAGGYWTDDSSTGVDLSNPENVDLTSLEERPFGYDFTYHIDFPGCDEQIATVTFVVGPPGNPGQDSLIAFCENELNAINFNTAIGAHDPGDWIDISFSGLDFTDPSNVNITNLSPGIYEFIHEIPSTLFCPADSSQLTLVIQDALNAGDDTLGTVFCKGVQLDLTTFVNGQTGGDFVDVSGNGGLSASMINSNILLEGVYEYYYVIPAEAVCPGDTAIIRIEFLDALSAGNDRGSATCSDEIIDLITLVDGDPGGSFEEINSSGALSGSTFDPASIDSDTYDFYYIVGDGMVCPIDTAIISIEVDELPDIEIVGDEILCSGDCFDVSYQMTGTVPFIVSFDLYNENLLLQDVILSLSTENTATITICHENTNPGFSQDTLFLSSLSSSSYFLTPSVISDNFCVREYPDGADTVNISIGDDIELLIDDILCPGDSININNQVYNEINPIGVELISTALCDTIYTIDLSFYEESEAEIDRSLCSGDTLIVGSYVFDELIPEGTVVLFGLAQNGCDSIVNVTLDFNDETQFEDASTLCADEFVEYNMVRYDIDNPTGRDTLFGQNLNGCDSIIIVNLNFYPSDTILRDETLCREDQLQIGTEIFNESRPQGVVVLENQNQDGCDSIVRVDLDFYLVEDQLVNDVLCEGDSLEINGTFYHQNNSSGIEILEDASPDGCDIKVIVDLSFEAVQEGTYTDIFCDSDTFMLGGELFDINRPRGMVLLEGAAQNGCDSLVDVQLDFTKIFANIIPISACEGELGAIQIEQVTGGTADFQVVLDGNTAFTVSEFPFDINNVPIGAHNLFIQDVNGCTLTSTVMVEANSPVTINGDIEYFTESGIPVNINLSSNAALENIQWFPQTGLSCTDCLNPEATLSETTSYTVFVVDENGCEYSFDVLINVTQRFSLFIPNVINPLNSFNSGFYIQSSADISNTYNMRIFDRWGNLIYLAEQAIVNDPSFAWDGRFNGDIVNPGVYVFFAEIFFPDGTSIIRKGDLTVIR